MTRKLSRAEAPLGARWTDIGSDVNWLEYGGVWSRHVEGALYHVIAFHNDGDSDIADRYCVTLSEVSIDSADLDSARECCGFAPDWKDDYGDPLPEWCKVEALHTYGARQEVWAHTGNNAHDLLAMARRWSSERQS